jgi:hypothetical protein
VLLFGVRSDLGLLTVRVQTEEVHTMQRGFAGVKNYQRKILKFTTQFCRIYNFVIAWLCAT